MADSHNNGQVFDLKRNYLSEFKWEEEFSPIATHINKKLLQGYGKSIITASKINNIE